MTVVSAPNRAISIEPGTAAQANSTTGRPARMPTSVSDMWNSSWIAGISGGTARIVIRSPLPASHSKAMQPSTRRPASPPPRSGFGACIRVFSGAGQVDSAAVVMFAGARLQLGRRAAHSGMTAR